MAHQPDDPTLGSPDSVSPPVGVMEDATPWVHITISDGFDYRKDYIRQADENLGECVWDYTRYAGLQPGDVILHNRTVPLNCYAPIQEQQIMNGDVFNVIINTARALPFRRPEFKAELLRFSPKDKDGAPYSKPTGPPTREDEVEVWIYLHDEWPGFPEFVIHFRALHSWRLGEVRDGVEQALGKDRGERLPLAFEEVDEQETLEQVHANGYVHLNLRRPRNAPSNLISIAGVDFAPGPGVDPADPPEDQVLLAVELEGPFEGRHKPRLGVRVNEETSIQEVLEWIRSRLNLGKPPNHRQTPSQHGDLRAPGRPYRWEALRVMHEGRIVTPLDPLKDQGITDGHTLSLVHVELATSVSPIRPEPKLLMHRTPGMAENGTVRALFGGVRVQVAETAGAYIGLFTSSADHPIQLQLYTEGQILIYDVGPDTLVGELQAHIRERTGIGYRILRADGTILDLSHTIAQAGLEDGEQLDLLVELLGGGSHAAPTSHETTRPRLATIYTLTRGDFSANNESRLPVNAIALQLVGDAGQWWIVLDQDAPLQKVVSLMEVMTEKRLRAAVDGERVTMNHSARYYGLATADQVELYEEQLGGGSVEPCRQELTARINEVDNEHGTGEDEQDDTFSETRADNGQDDEEEPTAAPREQISQSAFTGHPTRLAGAPTVTPPYAHVPRPDTATPYMAIPSHPTATPMSTQASSAQPAHTFATMFPSPELVHDVPVYAPPSHAKHCPERLMPRSPDEAYKYNAKYSRQFVSRYEQMGRLCGAKGEDLCDYLRLHVHDRNPDIFSIIERQEAYQRRDWESVKQYILHSFEGPESERYTIVDWEKFIQQPHGITSVEQ
ncbi:hypothetical protein V8E36_002798 [Tilletia maclaganii]